MTLPEIYQEIKKMHPDVKLKGTENAYKILFRLCQDKNIRITGSIKRCTEYGYTTQKQVLTEAKNALLTYAKTGRLHFPNYFTGKGKGSNVRFNKQEKPKDRHVEDWKWKTAKLITIDNKTGEYEVTQIKRSFFSAATMERLYDFEIPSLLKRNLSYANDADRLINSGWVVLRVYSS